MNRIGGRFGMQAGQGLQLSQTPNMPAAKQPPAQQMPQPQVPQPQISAPTVGGNRPNLGRPGLVNRFREGVMS
jgi:hypothetical protein